MKAYIKNDTKNSDEDWVEELSYEIGLNYPLDKDGLCEMIDVVKKFISSLIDKTEKQVQSKMREDLMREIVRLNTLYQKDYTSPKSWIMTRYDIENPMAMPTKEEFTQRHIGAITAISQMNQFILNINKLK